MSKSEGNTAEYDAYFEILYLTLNRNLPIRTIVLGDNVYHLSEDKPINCIPKATVFVEGIEWGHRPTQAELEDIFREENE